MKLGSENRNRVRSAAVDKFIPDDGCEDLVWPQAGAADNDVAILLILLPG
jgi:hypothetical protein